MYYSDIEACNRFIERALVVAKQGGQPIEDVPVEMLPVGREVFGGEGVPEWAVVASTNRIVDICEALHVIRITTDRTYLFFEPMNEI